MSDSGPGTADVGLGHESCPDCGGRPCISSGDDHWSCASCGIGLGLSLPPPMSDADADRFRLAAERPQTLTEPQAADVRRLADPGLPTVVSEALSDAAAERWRLTADDLRSRRFGVAEAFLADYRGQSRVT